MTAGNTVRVCVLCEARDEDFFFCPTTTEVFVTTVLFVGMCARDLSFCFHESTFVFKYRANFRAGHVFFLYFLRVLLLF